MKTSLQVDISFDQVLEWVRQLPKEEKIKQTKELEKDAINSKLSSLLNIFQTNELSLETINEDVEILRQEIYDKQKH